MLFGLCIAPAKFQQLMDLTLAGLQWKNYLVYLDNIQEHLDNLELVFHRHREDGLKLKPSKCSVYQKQVIFLGHVVSPDGIATDPANTVKVANQPIPACQREVQQFLGLVIYYRCFVKSFATLAKSLHHLTGKSTYFKWTIECQKALILMI